MFFPVSPVLCEKITMRTIIHLFFHSITYTIQRFFYIFFIYRIIIITNYFSFYYHIIVWFVFFSFFLSFHDANREIFFELYFIFRAIMLFKYWHYDFLLWFAVMQDLHFFEKRFLTFAVGKRLFFLNFFVSKTVMQEMLSFVII